MTFNSHKTGWSSRKDYKPLPPTPEYFDGEDRLGCLDRAIAEGGVHLDFAARCRAIIRDAERRGVATRGRPIPEPQHGQGDVAPSVVADSEASAGDGLDAPPHPRLHTL